MKSTLTAAILAAGLFAGSMLPTHAGWTDGAGKPVPDTPAMRSDGEFGVRIVLTADEQALRHEWNTARANPRLQTTDTVAAGGEVTAMLVFHGCKPNAAGNCEVVAAFALVAPDGKRDPGGAGSLWSAAPLPGRLMLGAASMRIGFTAGDAPGTYQIHARVVDRVALRTLDVVAPVRLLAR